jgi:hypothetical protein
MSDQAPPAPHSLTVFVTREAFVDFFILHIPKSDGSVHTEELDPDETVEWFRERGADMILVEKALDHVWNFYKGSIEIENYREPAIKEPLLQPKID